MSRLLLAHVWRLFPPSWNSLLRRHPRKKTTRADCWHQFGVQGAPGCKHFLFGQQHLRSILPCRPEMPFVCQAWTVLGLFLDFVLLLLLHSLFYTPSCGVSAVRTVEGRGRVPCWGIKTCFSGLLHPSMCLLRLNDPAFLAHSLEKQEINQKV